jgi:hypothetical protein
MGEPGYKAALEAFGSRFAGLWYKVRLLNTFFFFSRPMFLAEMVRI